MNETRVSNLGIIALVVVAASAGGTTAQSPGSASSGPSLPPTPSASPAPLRDGPLPAGTYVVTPFAEPGSDACFVPPQPGCTDTTDDDAIRVTFALPDGWEGPNIWPTGTGNRAPDGAGLAFFRGGWLYSDPCHASPPPDVPVGPTVNDFASALANHPILDMSAPVDVTLSGYSGKYMDLQVPLDISGCPDHYWPWEPGIYAQGPGHRWHLWILDVDGVRVVVQSTDYAGTSPEHQAELQAVVDSIRIEP